MKTTAEMIAVMQAFERGEDIQCIRLGIVDDWVKCTTPPYKWNWVGYDYRIKPREPRVIWVNEYTGNGDIKFYGHADEASARGAAGHVARVAIKYIEVIE
ncbi:hypothetical protein [Xanthomonas sp. LMG 12461]|uniref:hypothetical protein n=1 Tax=Xanthomonas sp. LMG 12461 TaxID=2014543 RepID=UPI001265072B|nr:hypothetical protein [Xanthomonas sp. LMG 12461]KAB7765372.1 hypothetical protein CEK68_11765 [Xanthomonas sp. LMG 12461]